MGVSRSQDNAERLRTAGAEAAVADVLDRENLLTAVRDVRADAVMHQLTALGTTKIRAVAVPEHDRLGEEAVGADRPGGREEVGRPRGAQVVCALGCATDRA